MHKQGKGLKLDGTLLALMALLVLGVLIALGFLQNLSQANRVRIVLISSLGIIGCFTGLIVLSTFRKRLRKEVWARTMAAWKEQSQAASAPSLVMSDNISENELKQLAIQIYTRIGYRVPARGAAGGYLQLINPDGRLELCACKQQPEAIKLHLVYSLELEMKRTKAVRGFFWAPGGFTSEAIAWVIHRPILLADRDEIGRLVDSATAKGSRFLG